MSFRTYLFLVILALIMSLATFGYVIYTINPFEADTLSLSFFYITLFLSVTGIIVLLNLVVRFLWHRDGNVVLYSAPTVFREGVFAGCTVVGMALLLATRYFVWWSGLLVLAFFGGVEALLLTMRRGAEHEEYV